MERIWCVVELYTFLKMGGSTDDEKLLVMPIASGDDEDEEALLEVTIGQCRNFDVTETKCFDEEQRQALLSVVELGFGSLETFDSLIRSIVPAKLEQRLMTKVAGSSQRGMAEASVSSARLSRRPSREPPSGGSASSLKSAPRVAPYAKCAGHGEVAASEGMMQVHELDP